MDFTAQPVVIIGYFTEGETYQYDFTLFPTLLAGFMLTPTGAYFNANIRHSAVPYVRL